MVRSGPRFGRAEEQTGRVVQQREVAEQGDRRAVVAERGTDGGGDGAVDAGHAPVGPHGHPGPRRRAECDVTHRVRRAQHDLRAVGLRGDQRPGPGAARPAPPAPRAPRPARPRRRSSASRQRRGVRGRRAQRGDGADGPDRPRHVGPRLALRARRGVHGDVRVGEQPRHVAVQRRAADDDHLVRTQVVAPGSQGPVRTACGHSGEAGSRDHRDVGRAVEAPAAGPGDDDGAGLRVERQRSRVPVHRGDVGPRAAARAPVGHRAVVRAGHQRLGERQVEVHRSGRRPGAPGRRRDRAADRGPGARSGGPVDLAGPAHGTTEQPGLRDRLARTGADELRRAVRGQRRAPADRRAPPPGRPGAGSPPPCRTWRRPAPAARTPARARAPGTRPSARPCGRAAGSGPRCPRPAARTPAARCANPGTARRRGPRNGPARRRSDGPGRWTCSPHRP